MSDGWRSYGGIRALQLQFTHRWVNHRLNFLDPGDRNVHNQSIEATWKGLKDGLRHLHGSNTELLPTYLFQYVHVSKIHSNRNIFQHFLEEMHEQYPF